MPELDGLASIGIGLVLAATAVFLARESKGLLIGEPASRGVEEAILRIAGEDGAVRRANGVVTVHLGPRQVVAALSAEFVDGATASEIEASVERLEKRISAEMPEITTLFVKPQANAVWAARAEAVTANG